MHDFEHALHTVRERIAAAERRFHRPPGSVKLLAVSKTKPSDAIETVFQAGQRAFGENHLQEALPKLDALATLPIEWHFIGKVQSNKTQAIAARFDWVHSVDREKIARRLGSHRGAQSAPLNVCIQVNVSRESSKSGVEFEELEALASRIAGLPGLKLRGLMAIPRPETEFDRQRLPFARLREAFEALRSTGLDLDTLSMGMTDDLEAAIAEGSTLVRIGTAIFGPRET